MSKRHNNKFHNPILSLFSAIRIAVKRITRGAMRSLLRGWARINHHDRYGRAGFVLPTVTMVLLVVVLLTITIMFRSMDRAKMAQYRRVDEQVLQAAAPAIDRASAKIEYLLNKDRTLPLATPSDDELYRALNTDNNYKLDDEDVLSIQRDKDFTKAENFNNTAWRFSVDTNNNGKYDSYVLYGIYFRLPKNVRARYVTEARALPMESVQSTSNKCPATGTSADLIDGSGWINQEGKLKKSFFVYTTTIPITDSQGLDTAKYEKFPGTSGFTALEVQQDVSRIPFSNNAVVYEDDLEISSGTNFRLNGRVFTNSNLLTTPGSSSNSIRYYLVSSPESCFYEIENSKIIVGGNVVNGSANDAKLKNDSTVDLFEPAASFSEKNQSITSTNRSTSQEAADVLYNSKAYEDRISVLIAAQLTNAASSDPDSVKNAIAKRISEDSTLDATKVREEELEIYFRERTRRVPYKEVAFGASGQGSYNTTAPKPLAGSGNTLRPVDEWAYPVKPNAPSQSLTGLTLKTDQLKAKEPTKTQETEVELGDRMLVGNNQAKLTYTGNTSAPFFGSAKMTLGKWTDTQKDRERPTQIVSLPNVGSLDRHGFWEKAAAQKPDPVLSGYGGLRVVTGAGIYERSSSFLPPPAWDDPATASVDESKYGGTYPIVWPDTMPMSPTRYSKVFDNVAKTWIDVPGWPLTTTNSAAPTGSVDPKTPKYAKGDLKMRATAVYHYAQDIFDPANKDTTQKPIACVSSYYDPSTRLTSLNTGGFPSNTDFPRSNNGIVYGPPTTARPGKSTLTGGLLGGASPSALEQQANMVFPDGRFANEPLRKALLKSEADRDLADQAAIDSALCALGILGTSGYAVGASPAITFPDNAIKEVAFLNAREVKAVEIDNTATTDVDETFTLRDPSDPTKVRKPDPSNAAEEFTTSYAMPLENRFPQEIRATIIDLNLLRNQSISFGSGITGPSPEYLLPNSGIIYATRDDALPDISQSDPNLAERSSGSDFKLDPTRRPNGILLLNGKYLARNDSDNNGQNNTPLPTDKKAATDRIVQEKGLILVSNVPVYIKGDFNLHSAPDGTERQEFKSTEALDSTWSHFYTRKTLDTDFACRPGDPRLDPNCKDGDTWRPATVLADAISLLSDNFRFGFRNEGDFDLRNNAGNAKIGYDLIGNDGIKATQTTNELEFADTNGNKIIDSNEFWIDLNGNGVFDGPKTEMIDDVETLLPPTPIKETEITAKAARLINGFNEYNNFVTNGLSSGAFSKTLDADKNPQVVGTALLDASEKGTGTAKKASDLRISDSHYLTINTTAVDSSYFNNFVTPIQRRAEFTDYVMEVCRKMPISACGPNDWVVGYDVDKNDSFGDNVAITPAKKEFDLTLYDLLVKVPALPDPPYDLDKNKKDFKPPAMFAGSTGYWRITEESQRMPRRVAFLRDENGGVRLDETERPMIVGIADPGSGAGADVKNGWLECFRTPEATNKDATDPSGYYRHFVNPANNSSTTNHECPILGGTNTPRVLNPTTNIGSPLWFVTNNNGARNYGKDYPLWFYNPRNPGSPVTLVHGNPQQPLLIPVLQLHAVTDTKTSASTSFPKGGTLGNDKNDQSRWLIPAKTGTTKYNLVFGSGDGPNRPGEHNGGLQNFPRFLENWVTAKSTRSTTQLQGSFIQLRRSRYATAPAISLRLKSSGQSGYVTAPEFFGVTGAGNDGDTYNLANVDGRVGYYTPPERNWGFDVGILSQSPDLFAQKFTAPSTEKPDNYFREVSRDDEWVEALLCSKVADPTAIADPSKATTNAVPDGIRPTSKCKT